MKMWRLGAGFAGVLALTACTQPASRSVALAGGDITAISPSGYCVDGASSQPQNDFAIIAPCATLGATDDAPDLVGLATIQVGPEGSGDIAQNESALRDYIITDDGNGLLSQTGNAADITILSSQAFDNQVMVHFADAGTPPVAGLQGEEWRAFRDINGRLVTIAVRGLSAAPLQDGPGATLLKLIIAGVRASADLQPEA